MTFASILVLLDHDKHCATRLQAAMRVAGRFDSHLTGLIPTGIVDLPNIPQAAASIQECAALAWDALRDQAERLAGRFHDECHAAALTSFDAVVEEADKAQSLIRHARCHDLTVLTQADPDEDRSRRVSAIVEQCVLQSARPTLLLPYGGKFDPIGTRVLVAWDESREAARAVADAIPFLRRARQVEVVCWNENGSVRKSTLSQGLAEVCGWLKRHGVSAEQHIEAATSGIADSMLSRAADRDIDLVVMGAYGHSRWTERVLGGATRGLLTSMTVPVLMSH